MSGISPKMSKGTMDATVEAKRLICEIGSGFPTGTPLKTIISRVAREVCIGERRVRAFWNGEVRRPHSDEIDALRMAAAKRRERTHSDELSELRDRISRLESILEKAAQERGGINH